MLPEIDLFYRFWLRLKGSDSVPKELILKIADAMDEETLSLLMEMDLVAKSISYEVRQIERQKSEQALVKDKKRRGRN